MPFHLESQAEPIPGYRLIERLGAGGFGEVWKCEAPGKILKAIKFVQGDLEDVTAVDDSFKAEQELRSIERIKNIRHPFILSIERYEIVNGQLMIVTELADCNLYDRFREYRGKGLIGIPRDVLLNYMDEIAEALDIMTTEHDLLHLDIKPQNLFLMYNHIKIGDFGLVKDLEGVQAKVTGGVTPVYAAPETFEGYVSRYSDQYSLAIVFQELLTGIRPFTGTNAKQLMFQHISAEPALDPLPPADRAIIAKALAKKPSERWENCTAMVQALRNSHVGLAKVTPLPAVTATRENKGAPLQNFRGDSVPPQIKPPGAKRIDDYFELGPITQVAGQRHPTGLITQIRKTTARPVTVPEDDSASGVLRPVLLIGLGQFGRATLQWVKQSLQLQFGPTGLPVIRSISVDTDPVLPSNHLARISDQEELLLTRLNRPARYVRSRDSLPPVEDWLNTNILYRMPRTQLTSGIRALGRLALVEHYGAFCSRIERDLKAIVEPQALVDAEKQARESFITRKPRVYIIGHLGGGTASGMFIDAAYIVKTLMRKHDFDESDVHAVCYIPDEECMQSADLPEANAVAALSELFHFQQAGMKFRALYEAKAEWVEEASTPFTQIQFIEIPPRPASSQEKQDKASLQIQKVAEVLVRTMVTPLGRIAEPAKLTAGTTPYQAIGLRVLNSPRRVLIRKASHIVFQNLLDQWLKPANTQVQQTVKHRIDGFFHFERYAPESLQRFFEQTVATSMEKPGDEFINSLVAPFQHGIQACIPNVEEVKRALREIIRNLGNTGDGSGTNTLVMTEGNTKLFRAIREACEKLVRTGATRLVYTIYRHMDKAGLRLSATEEALRYTLAKLDEWIAFHESKAKQANMEYAQAMEYLRQDFVEYERIKTLPRKKWPSMTTPGERLLALYRARMRALIHEHIAKVYVGFRGTCSDQSRDIRFCRQRLQELQQSAVPMEKLPERPMTLNRVTESILLPGGCKDLVHAVNQFAQSVTPDDMEKIDSVVGERLEKNYPRMSELCLSTVEQLRPVQELIMQEAKRFLDQRLTLIDAAGLFLEGQQEPEVAYRKVFEQAEPMLRLHGDDDCKEIAMLMVNDSDHGKALSDLATNCFPHTKVLSFNRNDEVIIYRSYVGVQIENLAVLNENGIQAYRTALEIEHFTPHSRQDVDTWQSPLPLLQ